MNKITSEDIELLKTVCFVFKKETLNNPNIKEQNWKDKTNHIIANIFNFEQRLIDLIEEKLKEDDKSPSI